MYVFWDGLWHDTGTLKCSEYNKRGRLRHSGAGRESPTGRKQSHLNSIF